MALDTLARAMAAHADSKAKTAYQYAVEGGYTGTEEEFEAEVALMAENAQAVNNAVRFDLEQSKSKSEKRQAVKNIGVYDDLCQIYKITDASTMMSDMETTLNAINTVGDHVFFDTSALEASMYLCTIYLDQAVKFYRITDMVTGFEKTGFYNLTDKLVDLMNSVPTTTGKHYTVRWDKTNAKCTRMNDAVSITDTTTNFGHFGSVNPNYDNPFDSIYPWSGRKLCNIDLDLYRGLTSGDDITDCVTAWEDDVNFSYENQYGVWVYTPSFFGRTFEAGNYQYFDVTDELTQGNISYPAQITGRWLGVDVTLTIDGASKHCNLPVLGMPMANIAVSTQHTYAKNYGGSLVDVYNIDASALLMVVEYATLNSQTAIGSGCSNLYKQSSFHPVEAVTASKTLKVSGWDVTYARVGAIVDIGSADGGNNIARTYVEAVSVSGGVATMTLHDEVTCATTDFVSLHGIINQKDEEIGSKSGYIGNNGFVNTYYRGECLYGNKFQYILGVYHQANTNKVWLAERGDTDNYDAINTSKHKDTGVVLAGTAGYVQSLGIAEGLAIAPLCTAIGGNSSNPVGDYYYIAVTSDTILLLGGNANNGSVGGLFCGYWGYAASRSGWGGGSRPRLKNP